MPSIKNADHTMKSHVKAFVSERLWELKKSRVSLADEVGHSLSYMSQAESGKVKFNDDLLEKYTEALQLNTVEAKVFDGLVKFQNALRSKKDIPERVANITVQLELHSGDYGDGELKQIEDILLHGKVSNFRKRRSRGDSGGGGQPDRITPQRYVEVLRQIESFKHKAVGTSFRGFFSATDLIEAAEAFDKSFEVIYHEEMPARFGDIYGCVEQIGGRTLLHISEAHYRAAERGDFFARRLLSHELSHYLLKHQGALAPLPLLVRSRNGTRNARTAADDPAEELEADVGAMLLLTDWQVLGKLAVSELEKYARDQRVEKIELERIYWFNKNPAVVRLLGTLT